MIIAGRRIIFKQSFLDELSRFEGYLGRTGNAKGRAFTAAVFDFCCDIVAGQPFAYPKFQQAEVENPAIRRAVFKRHYVLIYRVYDDALRFLSIYHTSQNEADLLLSED